MDARPGTVATRQNAGNDTLWVQLAPNPDFQARDAITGRATGVYSVRPVQHEVDDSPRRPWLSPMWNMIRPWRGANDAPYYGKTLGVRYGDRRDKTGLFS